jgi:hypothetical protein
LSGNGPFLITKWAYVAHMVMENTGLGPEARFKTEQGVCPICTMDYETAEEVSHRKDSEGKHDLPGIVYQHDGFWCGEWADGKKVEGGFERNNPMHE